MDEEPQTGSDIPNLHIVVTDKDLVYTHTLTNHWVIDRLIHALSSGAVLFVIAYMPIYRLNTLVAKISRSKDIKLPMHET